jgi:hypothetical protein
MIAVCCIPRKPSPTFNGGTKSSMVAPNPFAFVIIRNGSIAPPVEVAIRVARKLKAIDVIDVPSDLFILRGVPAHIRSDNGPEFVAKAVQEWIAVVGAKTAYIERGSPWETLRRLPL